jgi:hypothetical protein
VRPQTPARTARGVGAIRQTLLHVPQLLTSVCLLTHCVPQRSGVCPPQVDVHTPFEHTWLVVHWMPQPPQCELLIFVSTHCPLQSV